VRDREPDIDIEQSAGEMRSGAGAGEPYCIVDWFFFA